MLTSPPRLRRLRRASVIAAVAAVAIAQAWPARGQQATMPLPDLTHITAANREQIERDAVQYLRAVRAADIDPDLPAVRLDRWLESVLRLPSQWEMNECGEARQDGHGPICVRVSQASRGVDILFVIGRDDRGVGRPRMVRAGVRLFDIDSNLPRLAELPDMVSEAEARRQRFADHPMQTLTEADVMRLRVTTRANTLQPDLPSEPFEAWFQSALAADTPQTWTLVSCSAVPSAAAPQCVNVDVRWPDGARARVTLDLEMVQRGLAAEPSFRLAFVYRGGPARTVEPFRSLREFSDVVRAVAVAADRR